MICNETREYLFAFLDNELDAHLSIEVQRHLDHCPDCAQQADIEREIAEALDCPLGTGMPRVGRARRERLADDAKSQRLSRETQS